MEMKCKWNNISEYLRLTFFSSLIWGFLAHGYMICNKLSNSDDLTCQFITVLDSVKLGRWMQSFTSWLRQNLLGYNYSVSWIIGIKTILIIAVMSCLIVEILQVHNKVICVLLSGLIVTFPFMTSNMSYMFSSSDYALSALLSVTSVYVITHNTKKSAIFLGAGLIACSLGIYQSFLGFATGLSVLILIQRAFREEKNIKEFFLEGIRYVFTIILGVLTYFVITKITLLVFQETLTKQNSMNKMGTIGYHEFNLAVKSCYTDIYKLATENFHGITPTPINRLIVGLSILFFLVTIAIAVIDFIKRKRWIFLVELLAMVAILPIAINVLNIMKANNSWYMHTLMTFPIVLIYIAMLVSTEEIYTKKFQSNKCIKYICKIEAALISVLILGYIQLSNISYMQMQMVHESALSYFTTLKTKVESVKGYSNDVPIIFVGTMDDVSFSSLNSQLDDLNLVGVFGLEKFLNGYSRERFLEYYCGWAPNFKPESEMPENIISLIETMPVYPANGSINLVNGTVIVKFSDVK